jgi:uncharacterized phage infection (PIP) family protein YhgE
MAEVFSSLLIFALTESVISIDFLDSMFLSVRLFLIVAQSFFVVILVVSVSFLGTTFILDSDAFCEGSAFLVCAGFLGLYFVVSKFLSPKAL